MSRLGFIGLLAFVALLSSCLKEQPVTPPDPQPAESVIEEVDLGGDEFSRQLYFDLGTGQFTGNVDRLNWDLALDCRDGHFFMWLNSANSKESTKLTVIAPTGETQMRNVTSVDGLDNLWKWETSTGDTALNSLGHWWHGSGSDMWSDREVYAVSRGYSHDWRDYNGTAKLQVDSISKERFVLTGGDIDGSNLTTIAVDRDASRNFSYISFEGTMHQVDIEPAKEDWDMVFTRYVYTYDDPPDFPYPVIGVLINPSNVEVGTMMLEGGMEFDSISIYDVTGLQFSNQWDIIGWDWKIFDNTGYTVDPNEVYIIQSYEGDYFKFRFLDYYNDQGMRGYPKFEYAPL